MSSAARLTRSTRSARLLGVPAVHTIGYCVAGTTLAVALAWLAANDRADTVASATFFTAQVDFEQAGDLKMFVDDSYLALLEQLSAPMASSTGATWRRPSTCCAGAT